MRPEILGLACLIVGLVIGLIWGKTLRRAKL